jgi:hypothetical protein
MVEIPFGLAASWHGYRYSLNSLIIKGNIALQISITPAAEICRHVPAVIHTL